MEKTQQQKAVDTIRAALFCLQDEAYRDFQSALMPTVSKERVIGVRTPKLRKLAKQFGGHDSASFINGILGKIAAAHEKKEASAEQMETEKA